MMTMMMMMMMMIIIIIIIINENLKNNPNHDFSFKRLAVHVAYLSLLRSRLSVIT